MNALEDHPLPILFIDEVHATVGAGATTGGTMDLATLIKPLLSAGDLRVIGSTTFEEFKHIEKDRALARRLQKIVIEEPSVDETSKILEGLQSRYEEHHGVTFAPETVPAAARLAKRHLRESRLPDAAIDIIDEAGATIGMRRTVSGGGEPGESAAGTSDAGALGSEPPQVTVEDIERVVARMARIPDKQATSSDKERLRTLDEALERVVFRPVGGGGYGCGGDQAFARRRGDPRPSRRLLPLHRPDAASGRRSWPASSPFTWATSSSATT